MEAVAISSDAGQIVQMDDETYRLYLAWKIAINTSNCTHADRHRTLKMFWSDTPLIYSEQIEHQATIFITIPALVADLEAAVFKIAAMIKAAGVALHFIFTEVEYTSADYSAGAIYEITEESYIE